MILYKKEFFFVSGVKAFLRNVRFGVKRLLMPQPFTPGTFMVIACPIFLLTAMIKNKEWAQLAKLLTDTYKEVHNSPVHTVIILHTT